MSWLQYGTESCHCCSHAYVYELELRCVGCDRGVCEQCALIERATAEAWCAACRDEQQSGGGAEAEAEH
jgi:hypothetical protein